MNRPRHRLRRSPTWRDYKVGPVMLGALAAAAAASAIAVLPATLASGPDNGGGAAFAMGTPHLFTSPTVPATPPDPVLSVETPAVALNSPPLLQSLAPAALVKPVAPAPAPAAPAQPPPTTTQPEPTPTPSPSPTPTPTPDPTPTPTPTPEPTPTPTTTPSATPDPTPTTSSTPPKGPTP